MSRYAQRCMRVTFTEEYPKKQDDATNSKV